MKNHREGGFICDVITYVKLLNTNCYHTKRCSANKHLVPLYLFMVPMTPFLGSWLMDYVRWVRWLVKVKLCLRIIAVVRATDTSNCGLETHIGHDGYFFNSIILSRT